MLWSQETSALECYLSDENETGTTPSSEIRHLRERSVPVDQRQKVSDSVALELGGSHDEQQ